MLTKEERLKIFLESNPERAKDFLPLAKDIIEGTRKFSKTEMIILERIKKQQEKKDELKKRLFDMAEMRVNGSTLDEIGKKYGVTREAIRHLMKKYFVGTQFPTVKRGKKILERSKGVCQKCQQEFLYLPSVRLSPKFCSRKCFMETRRQMLIERHGFHITKSKSATPEQIRQYNAVRTKAYYHQHKHEKKFKERVKYYNYLASLRVQNDPVLKEKRNARYREYQKRKRQRENEIRYAASKSVPPQGQAPLS